MAIFTFPDTNEMFYNFPSVKVIRVPWNLFTIEMKFILKCVHLEIFLYVLWWTLQVGYVASFRYLDSGELYACLVIANSDKLSNLPNYVNTWVFLMLMRNTISCGVLAFPQGMSRFLLEVNQVNWENWEEDFCSCWRHRNIIRLSIYSHTSRRVSNIDCHLKYVNKLQQINCILPHV